MNIGFIGAGGVARVHMENVAKMRDVKIVGVCDVDDGRASEYAAKYGARPYTDYRKLLKGEQLDACYVCVIPSAHGSIERQLAEAKIPMYVEKPIHLSLRRCAQVIEAIQKAGIINGVGYHWRYTRAAKAMKKFCDGKQISLVDGAWYGGMPGVEWWRRMEMSGGQLVEQTTHIVDLARHLAGEVHTVFARATTGAMSDVEGFDVHDASVATLEFDSGAVGVITSGCIAEQHGSRRTDLWVKGRNWSAWTDAGKAVLRSPRSEKEVETGQSWPEQIGNGDKAFISALRTNDPSKLLSDYRSGAQSLAISLAATRSIQTGKPVKVERFV